jgi:hypothetical protein
VQTAPCPPLGTSPLPRLQSGGPARLPWPGVRYRSATRSAYRLRRITPGDHAQTLLPNLVGNGRSQTMLPSCGSKRNARGHDSRRRRIGSLAGGGLQPRCRASLPACVILGVNAADYRFQFCSRAWTVTRPVYFLSAPLPPQSPKLPPAQPLVLLLNALRRGAKTRWTSSRHWRRRYPSFRCVTDRPAPVRACAESAGARCDHY